MVTELLKHWELAVDGLQILLCLLILFFLVRNYRRKMKPGLVSVHSQFDPDFNFQVFTEAINQQVELAFANILQVAGNERQNLEKILQLHQLKYSGSRSKEGLPPAPPSHHEDTQKRMTGTDGQGERQARIQQLAAQGLSAKQISDELKTPLGEVELVMSLQKRPNPPTETVSVPGRQTPAGCIKA
jgi:hypothetical protein